MSKILPFDPRKRLAGASRSQPKPPPRGPRRKMTDYFMFAVFVMVLAYFMTLCS